MKNNNKNRNKKQTLRSATLLKPKNKLTKQTLLEAVCDENDEKPVEKHGFYSFLDELGKNAEEDKPKSLLSLIGGGIDALSAIADSNNSLLSRIRKTPELYNANRAMIASKKDYKRLYRN